MKSGLTFRDRLYGAILNSQQADGSWSGNIGPIYVTAVNLTILQLDKRLSCRSTSADRRCRAAMRNRQEGVAVAAGGEPAASCRMAPMTPSIV